VFKAFEAILHSRQRQAHGVSTVFLCATLNGIAEKQTVVKL
jgi:hypothetical protein